MAATGPKQITPDEREKRGRGVKDCLKTQPVHTELSAFQSMILSQLGGNKKGRNREKETGTVMTGHIHSSFAARQHGVKFKANPDSAPGDKTEATQEK